MRFVNKKDLLNAIPTGKRRISPKKPANISGNENGELAQAVRSLVDIIKLQQSIIPTKNDEELLRLGSRNDILKQSRMPEIKVIVPQAEQKQYSFEIKRDSNGRIKTVLATPLE